MKRRADEDEGESGSEAGPTKSAGPDQSVGEYSDVEGEKIDYTDDDDDGHDYDNDASEDEPQSKRKKKKKSVNQFFDIEASDDDEEEEEEDEDEDGYGEGSEELSEGDLPSPEDYLRRPPPRMVQRDEEEAPFDAEAEERRLRKLYGRSRTEHDGTGPMTAMLLPKATDPKLWLVKCRPGRERDAVAAILRGLLDLDRKGEEVPQVFSAVCRDTLKGYVYIEAFKPADIMAAIKRLHLTHMVFASPFTRPSLVPMAEMSDVLAPSKLATGSEASTQEAVAPGDWVRVKRGKYAGDLAQVLEVPDDVVLDSASMIRIKLLPRLSYRVSSGNARTAKERPPARSFDPQEAAQYGSVSKSRGLWVYAQEFYSKEGFLIKEVKLGSLSPSGVTPRPDELERFGDDSVVAAAPAKKKTAPVLMKDDRVIVTDGDLLGIKGAVEGVAKDNWITVKLEHPDIKDAISLRADQVTRSFDLGDPVRIVSGPHSGNNGVIVSVSPDWKDLLVISFASQRQFEVTSSDVVGGAAAAAPAGGPSTDTDLELMDLVQDGESADFGLVTRILADEVTIVDQAGTSRNLPVQRVKRIDVVKADSSAGDAFKAGDRVQVDTAQGQAACPATILQVYRTVAFCRAVDTQEILVRRFPSIHKLGPLVQGGSRQEQQDYARPAGGRHLLGKSVTIAGGPYKGYAGIVKDITDTMARVELHTNSKLINVDRERLVPVDGSRGDGRGGKTPAWSMGKTPAWNQQGKTPAWNAGSGKTPAWNAGSGKTPAWNVGSCKTPAWNAGSGKTPAWNAGDGKTPAWNAGSGKTPTWNAGGKTPTWNAGGKTPTWNAGSGKTPVWSAASAATPAWSGAAGSSDAVPAWAQPGVLVRPKGSSGDAQPVTITAQGRVTLQNGQSYRPADLEPAVPAKKDRVRILAAPAGEPATGVVIGLDGPDAVVRLDETSSFRIVPLQNLGRLH